MRSPTRPRASWSCSAACCLRRAESAAPADPLDVVELEPDPPGGRVREHEPGQATRAPRPLVLRHLERLGDGVRLPLDVERVDADRVAAETEVRPCVPGEEKHAVAP